MTTTATSSFIPDAPPSLETLLAPEIHTLPVLPAIGILLAVTYLVGAVHLWRRGRRWSPVRTGLFLFGCGLIVAVTGTETDSYGTVLFSVFMFQQLTLMIAVPPLLVWGSPGRLLLTAVPHTGAGRYVQRAALGALRSKGARILLHPAVTIPLFLMSYYGLYLSGIADTALGTPWGHTLLELLFLTAGILFTIPVLSDDPLPVRHGHGARIIDISVEMALHVFFGVIIMLSTTVLVDAFANPPASWGIDPLEDQGVAGGLAWGYGEGPTVIILLFLLHRWFVDDTRRARARRTSVPTETVTPTSTRTTNTWLASPPHPPHLKSRRGTLNEDSYPNGAPVPSPQTRTPSEYQRNAFAPAILAAAACLAGIALIGHEYYLAILLIVAILAIIIGWFAIQAKQWWWAPVMLAIAVLWNPLYPFPFTGPWWVGAHIAAAAVFLAAGAMITTVRQPSA